MHRRFTLIAILVAALAAAGVTALLLSGGGDGAGVPPLKASPFPKAVPAPVTLGEDSTGAPVQLPRAGRPALVTFLFAECPDVCPLVAQEMSVALDRAGDASKGIDVVAISVDPVGDTPARVREFLRVHKLTGRMRYIVGTRAQLGPLWRAWGVLAQPDGTVTKSVHTAKVILVDAQGRQVGAYPGAIPFSVDDLAADIRTLTGS